MTIITDIALFAISVILFGLLTALKAGLGELLKALEAIHEQLARR